MRHYRVDKMADIVVTNLPRSGQEQYPNFQVASYGQKHFAMYSGKEMTVTLRGPPIYGRRGLGPLRTGHHSGP